MSEQVFALGLKNPVCSLCGEQDCAHLDGKPRCKHCGRRRKDHVGDDRKCLFEPTCYEPMKPSISTLSWEYEGSKRYREVKEKRHVTRGGVGSVGCLRSKR